MDLSDGSDAEGDVDLQLDENALLGSDDEDVVKQVIYMFICLVFNILKYL
jgi:hypothetical protein